MTTAKEFRDSLAEPTDSISAIHGDGSPEDPMRFFEDDILTVSSERWDGHTWHGWEKEILEPREYFKRKLKGK